MTTMICVRRDPWFDQWYRLGGYGLDWFAARWFRSKEPSIEELRILLNIRELERTF